MKRAVLFGGALLLCAGAVTMAMRGRPGHSQPPRTAGPYDVSPLETTVLGQSRWLRGGPASLRVIINDHETGKPVHAGVSIALAAMKDGKAEKPAPLYSGRTNDEGTLDAAFRAPANAPGQYELQVAINSPL